MNTPFVSLPSFTTPDYLAPSAWAEHIPFSFELITRQRPRIVVELGVFFGTSYFAFCQAVKSANIPAACYGVDSWRGDDHAGPLNNQVFEKVDAYNNEHYSGFSHLLKGEFDDYLANFADKSIDLLHIDGFHTYEAVKHDFESWLPKLSDSSVVLFHDTAVKDRGFGVFRLWEELTVLYPSFSFLHGYGLGVLATGKNIPPSLAPLFNQDEEAIAEIRRLYYRLGLPFTEKLKTLSVQQKAEEEKGELVGKIRWLEVQAQEKDQQAEKARSLEAQTSSEKEQLAEKIRTLETLSQEKDQLTEKVGRLEARSVEHEKQIDSLEKQIAALRLDNERKDRNIQQYYKANYELKKQLQKLSDEQGSRRETESHRVYKLEAEKKELESRLQDIYSSDGYRLLAIYYRFKGKYLPDDSPRLLRLKKIGRFLKSNKVVAWLRNKGKIPSVNISEAKLARDYNIVPEVPAGVTFPVVFPVTENPVVSIVIPAYNNWAYTRNCLISIYQMTEIPYEVIVGDNVSTDETVNLEKYFTNVVYLRNPENLGYIRNVNNAASHARGKFILTLNNDTTVTDGWLSNLVDVMDRDPKVGLVGSKLVYPNGLMQEAGGIIWRDASGWNYGREGNPEAPEYNYLKEVDYVSGASNLIRKEIWQQLKGLDERYVPAYFDDSDLAFSIRNLGYKTVYQPLSVVIHYEGMAHGTDTSSGTKKYQVINREKFIGKWKTVLEKENFSNGEEVFYARDKSKGKKTIVVIDHYVPQFDKDAGSRTTFQLLQLFVRLNYNVKFIGDNFFKHEPYTTILQQMGIEVLYGEYYRDNWKQWIINNKKYIDYFYINRPHISIKYINFLRLNTASKIVYYGHDLHFVRERLQYEIEKDPALLPSIEEWKKTETELIKQSDTILTLSCEEKEIIEKEIGHSNVRIMPAFSYSRFNEPVTDFDRRKNLLFVGGFGHKPNVDAVLWFAREVFPTVRRELKDVRFIIAGSKPPEEVTRLASSSIDVRGYVSDEELAKLYRDIKLVVVPLRYGAGVKGKTVETMYYGVPFVTSHFGIEGLQNIREVTGSHDSAEQFATAILELYNDSEKLKELSRKEVEYAKKYFSEDNVNNLILETFS